MKNTLLTMIEPAANGSELILAIRLSIQVGPVNHTSIYASTLCSAPESKDQFYEKFDAVISRSHKTEQLYMLGDFNARVGADHEAWPTCLEHHGLGNMNENGQILLEMCSYHELSITNTFFKNKPCRKVSWRHPMSCNWHRLDLVVTRRNSLNNVLNMRSYHSADCDITP